MDYFPEFYGTIFHRPSSWHISFIPKPGNFMEKYGLFSGIYGNSPNNPRPSLTIAYKPYPPGPEFYGIVWFIYGNFMENLAQSWAAMRHHGGTYGKFTDFHGKFYGKLMEWRIHKIRLLGPTLYKETPDQAAPVFGAGSKLWKP